MTQSNIALVRKTFNETVTFAAPTSPETSRELKNYGFECRHGHWVKADSLHLTSDEQTVAGELAE